MVWCSLDYQRGGLDWIGGLDLYSGNGLVGFGWDSGPFAGLGGTSGNES